MKSLTSLLLGSVGLLVLGACSDKGDAPGSEIESGDVQRYGINVSLVMPNTSTASRSDDGVTSIADDDYYYNGTDAEHKIETIYFVFYNEGGLRVASTSVSSPQFEMSKTDGVTSEWKTMVEFTLPVGTRLPAYVMAYANPRDVQMAQSASLSDMKTAQRGFYDDYNGNFIMTNATYFDTNGNCCTEVATDDSYYVELDDDVATVEDTETTPTVTIYIERIAVKVELGVDENVEISDVIVTDASGTDKEIKFVVDNWGINCASALSYYCKYFDPSIYTSTFVKASFSDASYVFSDWNSFSQNRCFWAYSVLAGEVEDSYVDYADSFYTGSDSFLANNEENAQKYVNNTGMNYISFSGISNEPGAVDYCLEHTPAIYTAPSALTSAIISGHYVYTEDEKEVGTFYVIANNYAGSTSVGTYYTEEELKKYMLLDRNASYLFNENGETIDSSKLDDFVIVHPVANETDENTTANVARLVTINLNPDKVNGYYVKNDSGSLIPVTSSTESNGQYISVEDVNKRLYLYADVAEAFVDGCAYYHWPIRHLNPSETSGKGYYAVVRNHWYKINVASIKGLGTGVFNPDVPIVPQDEQTRYSINADVKILAWRLVEQNANLGK